MERLLYYLEDTYPLKAPLSFTEKVTTGFLSQNFILEDASLTRFFLKQYRFNEESQLKTVHDIKHFFAQNGLPVILPLPDHHQKTFFQFDQNLYALFPFIKSTHLTGSVMDENAINSLAKTLAKLHKAGAQPNRPPAKMSSPNWQKKETLEQIDRIKSQINQKSTSLSAFDNLAVETLSLKATLISENSLTQSDLWLPSDHLTHGDYQDRNVFFNDANEVEYIFDFEKADIQPRVLELFRSMDYIFLNGVYTTDSITKAQKYLKYYHQEYSLTKEEVIKGFTTYYMKIIHGLWIEKEHYLHNNFRPDSLYQFQLPTLKYLSKHKDQFINQLVNQLDS